MPTTAINADQAGSITTLTDASFSTARGASTGTMITSAQQSAAVRFQKGSGRGGATYSFTRYFIKFDTSTITTNVTAATLTIKSFGSPSLTPGIITLKSDAFTNNGALQASDINNFDSSTQYASAYGPWANGGSNNVITLNSSARSDIQSDDTFIVCLMDQDHDFGNEDTEFPSLTVQVGIESGGSDIHLDVTHDDPAGYSHPVIGVASANISAVKGVATAKIAEVIGRS